MGKGRLEAFSDGVLAIIITIMVLELKIPHGEDLNSLKPLLPVFLSYLLSFVNIGIYWNNHHHMLHAAQKINGKVMWANMHLLFWLSMIPFATGWMGEHNFPTWPIALYGVVLFMSGIAYYILAQVLIACNGKNSTLAKAFGRDRKGIMSGTIYFVAIFISFLNSWISLALYAFVSAMWFIPDRRIEKTIDTSDSQW